MVGRFCRTVDSISENSGKIISFLFFPGWLLVLYGVVARYFFNRPNILSGEYAKYLFSVYFVLGGAYCLRNNVHIRVDIIYNLLNRKTRIMVEAFVVFPLMFCFIFPFIWHGAIFAWTAIKFLETDPPPTHILLFPIKITVPVAGILLLLQAVADLYRSSVAGEKKGEESHVH